MRKLLLTVFTIFIFLFSCSSGKNSNSTDSVGVSDDTTTDQDNGFSDDIEISDKNEKTDDVTDKEDGTDADNETDTDNETDIDDDDIENLDQETTDNSDAENDSDIIDDGTCAGISIPKTYNFGTVVHGGSLVKHVKICNRCHVTLLPDPLKQGKFSGKCDSFFLKNIVIGGVAIDTTSNFDILLSMSLKSGECAELDAVFDSSEAAHYPEPVYCEVSGGLLNGEVPSVLFTGSSAASAATTKEKCPASKGLCYINGTCYANGSTKPDNLCLICDSGSNSSAWTNAAVDKVCDDGNRCTDSDKCNYSGVCSGIPGNCSPVITRIDAGDNSVCAVDSEGKGYCWGLNNGGQIGAGSNDLEFTSPTELIDIPGGIKQIDIGYLHACAVSNSGLVYCWGGNQYGQLGNEEPTTKLPVVVSGLSNAVVVSANGLVSCALIGDGTVKCWGDNEKGMLGNGTIGNGSVNYSAIPVDVAISNVTDISVGQYHVCALIDDGTVKCWGGNQHKQVVDSVDEIITTPIAVAGINNAVTISCGNLHSCVVLESGKINCWGDSNNYAVLGNPLLTHIVTPIEPLLFRSAKTVSVGVLNTCATLLGGEAVCWGGNNEYGQVGAGWTSVIQKYPVDVRNLISGVEYVAAGNTFSCAILTGRSVKCWGSSSYGQLGQGDKNPSLYPLGVIW